MPMDTENKKGELMDTKENTKKKTEFEIERIYIGKPMEEVFENIIEHILEDNIIAKGKEKTRISDLIAGLQWIIQVYLS